MVTPEEPRLPAPILEPYQVLLSRFRWLYHTVQMLLKAPCVESFLRVSLLVTYF